MCKYGVKPSSIARQHETTVELVCSGQLGTSLKCPDYQGVQVSLHVNALCFGTITKCPDYGGVPIFKYPDNKFHCITINSFPAMYYA